MKPLLFQVIVIEVLALPFTDAQSLPCSVDSGGACPDVVCPGDVVTYTCDVTTVMGSNVWRLPAGTCTDSEDAIALAQTTGCSAASGMCGPFEAANQPDVGGQCLVSTLTVTVSLDISNSLIQCTNEPPVGDAVSVDNATILVAGPPPLPTDVSVASCTVGSVTLVWEDTSSMSTSYVLSATPTVENCDPNCTTSSRVFNFTGLQLEQTYMVDVSGINCGNQIGNAASYSVDYSGPAGMSITTVDIEYVYDEAGDLRQIRTTWVPVPLSVDAVPCGLQNSYTVTYESGSGPTAVSVQCSDMSDCMHTFDVATEGSNYTVSVMGFEATSPVEVISGRNVFLSVMVDASDLPWRVTCTFLSGYSAGENVVYEMRFWSTADGGLPSGAGVSTMAGGDGDTVVILINNSSTGGGPPAMTEYRYEVTTSSTTTRTIVSGTFVSGDYCGEIEMAGDIPNGMLSYTGLTPGSIATVSCEDGYELSGGNGTLVCQDDGTWSGPTPTCEKSCRESDLFEGGDDTNPSLCHAGEMPVEIPGGVLSCTGLTPGSTATASCEDGYEPSGEVVCQVDGTWNGTTPTCEKAGGDDGGGNSTPVIIGVVIAVIIILVIAALVVLLLLYFLMKKKQKKSDKHSGPLVQVQVNEQDFVARDSPIDPGTRVSGVVGAMGTIDRKEQQPTSRMSSTFESSHRDPETGEATNGESHHQYSGSKIKKKKRTSRVTSDSSTAELQKSMPEEVLYADLSHEGRRPAPPPPAEEPVVYSEVKTSTSAM